MTRHLLEAWQEVRPRIASADRLALFTDFDGTLTPIRREAGSVRLAARMRRVLVRIAARGLVLGVVSGRALADVRARVGVKGIWYAGDHGFAVRSPGGRTLNLATPRQRIRIALVTRELRHALRGVAGVTVEAKDATVAVHYRGAPIRHQQIAADIVQRTMGRYRGLSLMHGKKVWEVVPAGQVDKSAAVRRILGVEQGRTVDTWLSIYMGDDVADERVFASWNGLSIAVGYQPHTAAQYYLRSLAEVHEFLQRLVDTPPAPRLRPPTADRDESQRGRPGCDSTGRPSRQTAHDPDHPLHKIDGLAYL